MTVYRTVAYTTTGTKESLNLDPSISPFNASVAVTLSNGGSVSYKGQFSLSPMTVADADALWFDSADFAAATAASKVGYLTAPVARFRIVIASLTGTLTLQVLQGFTQN
jgi:hypothetical protein